MKFRHVSDLATEVAQNEKLAADIKEKPVETLAAIADSPLQTDVWIYRLVVLVLGSVVLTTIVGTLILGFLGKTIPESVVSIGSVAIGALGGLLAPSPQK